MFFFVFCFFIIFFYENLIKVVVKKSTNLDFLKTCCRLCTCLNVLLKVVPRGDVAAAAVAQPVRVGRDTVVPPPLDVQRGQVQCNCVRHLEKEFTAKLV